MFNLRLRELVRGLVRERVGGQLYGNVGARVRKWEHGTRMRVSGIN